jgi:hypothetical protein
MKIIVTESQVKYLKNKIEEKKTFNDIDLEINNIKKILNAYLVCSEEKISEKLYFIHKTINEINNKLHIKNQILEFKKNDLPLVEKKIEKKINESFNLIVKNINTNLIVEQKKLQKSPTGNPKTEDTKKNNKFLNWIKKFKWSSFFEGLRKVLQSSGGQLVQRFLSTTGVGAIGTTTAWGILTLYDLWNLIKGNGNWFYIIIDLVSIVSGGWVGNKLASIQSIASKGIDDVAKAIAKNEKIRNIIKPLLTKMSNLDTWLKKISSFAQKKLKASFVAESESKTNTITTDLVAKIDGEIKKEESNPTAQNNTSSPVASQNQATNEPPPLPVAQNNAPPPSVASQNQATNEPPPSPTLQNQATNEPPPSPTLQNQATNA